MEHPTSTVTSSSCNDIHVSAIISKDSNDILESSITSTVHIEPPDASNSTPHVEQHSVPSRVHQLLLDSTPGGSELWTWKFAVEFKPHIGQFFGTLESFRDRKRKAIVLDSGEEQETLKPFDIRNTKLTRIGCTAMIEFRYNRDGHLHLYHKKTIIDHSRVNQGPTTAFRNVKEYVDGYENVGAQLVDFKNFGRDIKCFIGDRDAQLFVNHFEDKRDTSEGFYFAYEVDSGKCLVRAFWCDAESRRNYALFGDYITYDPTYSTNKYCMVYSFYWGRPPQKREPHFIINDQCARIKKGLCAVFKHARRRYYMWHIMQKLTDKVGPAISKETDFVSRLKAIIWDAELEPLEFEEKWSQTTQRSKSQNNFFKRFENAHGTLVKFLMRFQSAIDVQRHTQKQLDRDDDCTLPQLSTSLKLEAHASKVYTHSAFADFQLEASASICSLSVGGFTQPANGIEVIGIADARMQKTYQVV
ncbi:protein FAR1-RELATED SEQUENCE 5-like [Silene latifolia]|uniref:protein FAR1-RELATED SEQUENCE 5-like n=1 Tax=Silene latifolia TaxID=37657 RepID=UPI003D771D9B